MLINLLLWIILGALAGWIASIIMGRNAQMGPLANIIVGIIGGYAAVKFVGLQVATENELAGFAARVGELSAVKPQAAFLLGRPVTLDAVFVENWPNVTLKIDFGLGFKPHRHRAR